MKFYLKNAVLCYSTKMYFKFIWFLILYFLEIQALSGVTPAGEIYICLTIGTVCPTDGSTGTGTIIDPRIITPSEPCPAGYFPCIGEEPKCGVRLVDQINTGDGLASPGAHPWQVYLRNSTNFFAGSGVLLDAYHVLTAAHKVYENKANPSEITAFLGVWDPTNLTNTQVTSVEAIFTHPYFTSNTLFNDIAILRLSEPIVFGIHKNINSACLPSYGSSFIGHRCIVFGWGQTSFTNMDAPTTIQKQVNVNIVDYGTCRTSFSQANLLGNRVDEFLDKLGEICAGGEAMKDACTQDGGSPLMCPDSTGKLNVAGIVIWGKDCGKPGVYGVYTNVAYYSNWVQTTTESLDAQYGK